MTILISLSEAMPIFDDDDIDEVDDDDVGIDARDGDDCDVDDDEVVDDVCNLLTKILTIALPCNLGIFM